jgi:hypothetical protein
VRWWTAGMARCVLPLLLYCGYLIAVARRCRPSRRHFPFRNRSVKLRRRRDGRLPFSPAASHLRFHCLAVYIRRLSSRRHRFQLHSLISRFPILLPFLSSRRFVCASCVRYMFSPPLSPRPWLTLTLPRTVKDHLPRPFRRPSLLLNEPRLVRGQHRSRLHPLDHRLLHRLRNFALGVHFLRQEARCKRRSPHS